MDKFFLYKLRIDYADEFYVYGFTILTEKQHTELQQQIKDNPEFVFDWSFGSNEEFDNISLQEFIRNVTVVEITNVEKDILAKTIGTHFGHFPDLYKFYESYYEE
jgi:hypothetical protein